jgi:heptosyltransferase-2
MNEAFRNILVISHENIGDIILSSAALKLLRQQYPEARITLLTSKVCRGIMEDGEVVNEAIWDTVPSSPLARQFYKLRTILRLRKGRYDACYFLGHPKRKIVRLCKYAGIPVRIVGSHTLSGKPNAGPVRFATHTVPVTPPIFIHVADYYQDIIHGYNQTGGRQKPFLRLRGETPPPSELAAATPPKKIALCFFGSNDNPHRWPTHYFDALISRLAAQGHRLFTLVSAGDHQKAMELVARNQWPVEIHLTKTLEQCADWLRYADLLISINTGQVHMAAALGVSVVSLSGRDTVSTYPYSDSGIVVSLAENCLRCPLDAPCRIREGKDAPDYVAPCIEGLTPEKVYPVIESMLTGDIPPERVVLV